MFLKRVRVLIGEFGERPPKCIAEPSNFFPNFGPCPVKGCEVIGMVALFTDLGACKRHQDMLAHPSAVDDSEAIDSPPCL